MWTELTGAIAALITTLCWVPQAVHILRTRQADGVSLTANIAFACGLVMWLAYGVMLGSWPLIASNAVTLVLVVAIIGLKVMFGSTLSNRGREDNRGSI